MGPQVAVNAGASRYRRLDVTLGHVSSNRFPADLMLPVHSHPEATVAVILAAASRFSHGRDPFAELIARRAANELDRPDDVTPLAVEAASLELIARVTRTALPERRPAWLGEARAYLHDRYSESFALADVAAAVGVEPERMARVFRRAFGEPLAGYLRRIRVDAAAHMLAHTDLPISQVAADVGFADQSHLTRCFSRYLGTTPGRYRAEQSRKPGAAPRSS